MTDLSSPVAELRRVVSKDHLHSPLPWSVHPDEMVRDADGRLVYLDGRQQYFNPDFVVSLVNAAPSLLEEIERLRRACEKAVYALGIAKYRLEGRMEMPSDPNSITSAIVELNAALSSTEKEPTK